MYVKHLKTGFRRDINGLRGCAVTAVILYHFNVSGFSGGFIGVDVFFVISGYLMISIIIRALESGNLTLLDFYAARIRRLVPALVVMCVIVLVIGWLTLPPQDYEQLAAHAIASLGFFSNSSFASEAGYFDVASHQKWLLHTWSLSVEWQFYLLLPLLLAIVYRLWPVRHALLVVVLTAGFASLATSMVTATQSSSSAFYLLPTRAWEMLAGGLVFMSEQHLKFNRRARVAVECSGFVLIALAICIFDGASAWPGWRAGLPVLGAMMVLAAGREDSYLTKGYIQQFLGDRSYSLYLWHWPVAVGLAFIEQLRNPWVVVAGISLTLLIAHYSYLWVETPFRQYLSILPRLRLWVVVGVIVSGALIPALAIRRANGFEGRLSPEIEWAAAASTDVNPRRGTCHVDSGVQSPSCVWGGSTWRVIALGDSHVSAIATAIAEAGGPNAGVVQWSYGGCPYVNNLKFTPELLARKKIDFACQHFVKWAAHRLTQLPADIPVVIASRYAVRIFGYNEDLQTSTRPDAYFSRPYEKPDERLVAEFQEAITKTACEVARHRKVYLLRPVPEMGIDVPRILYRRILSGAREDISVSRDEYFSRNRWVWDAQDDAARKCGVTVLDPTEFLCDADRCYGSRDMRPYFSDDDHLSEYGNKLLVPMFRRIYADIATHVKDPVSVD